MNLGVGEHNSVHGIDQSIWWVSSEPKTQTWVFSPHAQCSYHIACFYKTGSLMISGADSVYYEILDEAVPYA